LVPLNAISGNVRVAPHGGLLTPDPDNSTGPTGCKQRADHLTVSRVIDLCCQVALDIHGLSRPLGTELPNDPPQVLLIHGHKTHVK
jgi:hypothetical protein